MRYNVSVWRDHVFIYTCACMWYIYACWSISKGPIYKLGCRNTLDVLSTKPLGSKITIHVVLNFICTCVHAVRVCIHVHVLCIYMCENIPRCVHVCTRVILVSMTGGKIQSIAKSVHIQQCTKIFNGNTCTAHTRTCLCV